ncbi:HPr kinase/phosphorylase [Paracoccus sulfuroxidans]|uniref:Hpr(Ser) kinase/phosphatase n=1 Tax=Paracoccus sulfuroxidans TaxID=384678 RepID=A0A562NY09_9RHOB|nr:HPr kinase/phosphatase C-terminal domain-containing protein [Paracoccus sulfuroxidans]TWI37045.1 Hpr(Ser) kinase/phosphatase [Paracoccus sulfuroxidans]
MIVHASCVELRGRGLLILGRSGAGKSTLALDMMALGAGLVADDRTVLVREGDRIMADAPATIRGQIEARGVGILGAVASGPVPLALVVDLDRSEPERLPPHHLHPLLGLELPLVLGAERAHLCSALLQYLAGGRIDDAHRP